ASRSGVMQVNDQKPPGDAIRLKYSSAEVEKFNKLKLEAMECEGVISSANDRVQGTGDTKHHKAIRNAAKEKKTKDTQALPLHLQLKIGARYMMTVNTDTSDE